MVLALILGMLFTLFLPGMLLSMFLLPKLSGVERVVVSFVLSIFLDLLLMLGLGGSKGMKELTGGFTKYNVWAGLIIMSSIFGAMLLVRKLLRDW